MSATPEFVQNGEIKLHSLALFFFFFFLRICELQSGSRFRRMIPKHAVLHLASFGILGMSMSRYTYPLLPTLMLLSKLPTLPYVPLKELYIIVFNQTFIIHLGTTYLSIHFIHLFIYFFFKFVRVHLQ